jgi:hypothetical protein
VFVAVALTSSPSAGALQAQAKPALFPSASVVVETVPGNILPSPWPGRPRLHPLRSTVWCRVGWGRCPRNRRWSWGRSRRLCRRFRGEPPKQMRVHPRYRGYPSNRRDVADLRGSPAQVEESRGPLRVSSPIPRASWPVSTSDRCRCNGFDLSWIGLSYREAHPGIRAPRIERSHE